MSRSETLFFFLNKVVFNLKNHWVSVVAVFMMIFLLLISTGQVQLFLPYTQRLEQIEILQNAQAPRDSIEAAQQASAFLPLPTGKLLINHQKIWLRFPVPENIDVSTHAITVFSIANVNLSEMKAYSVLGDQATLLAHCSNAPLEKKCLSRSFKSFFQMRPSSEKNQWIYIFLNKPDQVIYNQFFLNFDDDNGLFSESILYLLSIFHGFYFFYFLLGILFCLPLKDISLFYFGVFFLGLFISSQFSRSIPTVNDMDPLFVHHTATSLKYVLLSIKTALILVIFDMHKNHKRLVWFFSSLAVISFILALLTWMPFDFNTDTIQLPFLTVNLLLLCFAMISLISRRNPLSLDITMAILVGQLGVILWSMNRTGMVSMSWVTDLYPLISEAMSGWLIMALIFMRVRNIIVERNLVHARMQEGRMAKSLLRALSHDLSNTTQVIISNAHLIEMYSETGKPIDKCLERIVSSSQVQSKIIKHFKNSYMIRGNTNIQLQKVVLLPCLNEALEAVRERILQKSLNVQIQNFNSHLQVLAEPSSLTYQVFANILGNSVKHAPTQSSIHIAVQELPQNRVQIDFQDQAGGIKPNILSKIFDEQIQLYDFKQDQESTGFGLLIVHDFVRSFGGEVILKNEPNDLNPTGLRVALILKR